LFFTVEPRKVQPILRTDEPVCPAGKLSCGNGECIEKELFCNDKPDCKDESDENACSKFIIIILVSWLANGKSFPPSAIMMNYLLAS